MKNLQGKELVRGDCIIASVGKGGVVAGNIIQFYDRNEQFLIHGYAIRLDAKDTILAADAFEMVAAAYAAATAAPAAAAADGAAAAKAAAPAAANDAPPPPPPPTPPPAEEPPEKT